MTAKRKHAISDDHIHRRPTKRDFQGKTIKRFVRSADNLWKFWFTDGSAFAIQSDNFGAYGLACMEVCDQCVGERP
jgi:hypothetical protein